MPIFYAIDEHAIDYVARGSKRQLRRPPHQPTRFGDRAFSVAASKAWNILPKDLKTATCSTDAFKRRLMTWLLKRADDYYYCSYFINVFIIIIIIIIIFVMIIVVIIAIITI